MNDTGARGTSPLCVAGIWKMDPKKLDTAEVCSLLRLIHALDLPHAHADKVGAYEYLVHPKMPQGAIKMT